MMPSEKRFGPPDVRFLRMRVRLQTELLRRPREGD
jgi:hypothetical protein